jgi:hypothetical protein
MLGTLTVLLSLATWWTLSAGGENTATSRQQCAAGERPITHDEVAIDSGAAADHGSRLKAMLEQYNSEIEFFGRVIDHDGKPLKGAKVSYSILMGGDLEPRFGLQRRDRGEVYSGDDGRFRIGSRKGMGLTISTIELTGYRESAISASQSFGYGSGAAQHHPDLAQPVDFLLISQDAAKPLVIEYKLAFKWDSSPASVSIGDSGATLVFVAKRNRPNGEIANFPWSLDISMPQGKVLRLPKGAAPIAPLSGYQNAVSYGHLAEDAKWIGGVGQERLAFRTRSGEYGRIDLHLYANRDESATAAYVTVYFNQSGGRNLE